MEKASCLTVAQLFHHWADLNIQKIFYTTIHKVCVILLLILSLKGFEICIKVYINCQSAISRFGGGNRQEKQKAVIETTNSR